MLGWLLLAIPVLTLADPPAPPVADTLPSVAISGMVQPRMAMDRPGSAEASRTGFRFRRARVMLDARLPGPVHAVRITPEFSGPSARLLDAWVDLVPREGLRLRAGQMQVPFNWQRDVSSARHHLPERSGAAERLGTPGGRDVGITARVAGSGWRAEGGIFDGGGMDRRTEVTPGGLASVRAVRSLRGPIPSSESDLARTPTTVAALGMGGQVAWRSMAPAWSPDLPAPPEARVRAGTADLVVHRSGGSLVLEGFARRIDPRTSGAEARTFVGGTVALGAFVMPRRLEMVGRASGWEAPGGASVLRRTTRELGANVHLDGHQAKVQTGLREVTGGDLPTLQTLVVQLQVLF